MLVAYSWTPLVDSVGGIENSLNSFLGYAPGRWPGGIEVWAFQGERGALPASPPAQGIAIRPLGRRRASLFPANLRFLLALWRNRARADRHSVLFLHRSDHALPYLGRDGPPLVLYIHGSAEYLSLPNESKLRFLRRVVPLAEQAVIRRSSHVFICSERGRAHYAQRYPRYARRFEVLPSAIDQREFRPMGTEEARRALGIDQAAFLVLFAGRIEEVKDPLLWANTFHQVCVRRPEARGAILGAGALAPDVLGMLECYGISDRLLCCKNMPAGKLALWYNAADVLLLTSHFEGSPRVVVEALACGTPVVCTDVGDTTEMLAYDVPLTICGSRDPMVLADAVENYAGYGKKCSAEFLHAHSLPVVFGRVLEVLEAAADGAARAPSEP